MSRRRFVAAETIDVIAGSVMDLAADPFRVDPFPSRERSASGRGRAPAGSFHRDAAHARQLVQPVLVWDNRAVMRPECGGHAAAAVLCRGHAAVPVAAWPRR